MREIVLDFTGCKYVYDIYEVFKIGFNLPDYFGRNLDALWDCLDLYTNEDMNIYLKGFHSLPDEFTEYMQKIWKVLCRVHKFSPNMRFEILS